MEFKKAACPHPTANNTEIKLSFNKLPLKILICRVLCFAVEKRIVCLSVQISSVHFLSKSVFFYQNDTWTSISRRGLCSWVNLISEATANLAKSQSLWADSRVWCQRSPALVLVQDLQDLLVGPTCGGLDEGKDAAGAEEVIVILGTTERSHSAQCSRGGGSHTDRTTEKERERGGG